MEVVFASHQNAPDQKRKRPSPEMPAARTFPSVLSQGRWIELLIARRDSSCRARQSQSRRRRTQVDSLERRAERAEALVHLGELSAGRHALEAAPLAPGNDQTRAALTDATRRPQSLRSPLPDDLLSQPEVPFQLSHESLLKNLKSSKRRAAGGLSGMTGSLTVIAERFWNMCQAFARTEILNEILQAVRMGRMTALQKPNGGVRGIVAGDIIRRLVGRTIAQQLAPAVERATAPFQYAHHQSRL